MNARFLCTFLFVFFLLSSSPAVVGISYAEKADAYSVTGLPLPRFVSLSRDETNVRTGPGQKYPVKWVIQKADLPVEIVLEYGNWRKIKDHEEQEGWVYHTLLSGKRTALIMGVVAVNAYTKPIKNNDSKSIVSLQLEPLSLVEIDRCEDRWCEIKAGGFSGWIERNLLWGVYEHENID